MHRPLLLRGARQLLTLRGPEGPRRGAASLDLGIIFDGSVLIRDGQIVSVGQSRRVDNLAEARNAVVIEAAGAVIMPALLDARITVPAAAPAARRVLQLAFSHGTMSVGACGAYFALRALGNAGPVPPGLTYCLQVEPEFDEAQLQRALRRNLGSFLRLDPLAHTRDELRVLRTLAPALRIHCDSPDAQDWLGLALAYGAGVVDIAGPLTRPQITLLADSPAAAVLTPESVGEARALLDGGAAVALGSGYMANAPSTCSMQTTMQLAVRDGGVDLAEAITMATINAAHALDAADRFGSLETGKEANLLVLHLSDYRDMVNFMGVNLVSKIIQAGTLVS